jgi:hypothetical protein
MNGDIIACFSNSRLKIFVIGKDSSLDFVFDNRSKLLNRIEFRRIRRKIDAPVTSRSD